IRPVQPQPGTSRPTLVVDPEPTRRANHNPAKTKNTPPKWRRVSPLVYISRLAILGVGLGAIAGTLLASWNPNGRLAAKNPTSATKPTAAVVVANPQKLSAFGQEILPLETQIKTLAAKYPQLYPEVFLVDLDSGNYVNLAGDTAISAASTIKVPVLVALLQDVDAGKVRLNEELTLTSKVIGSGSGAIQYQKIGSKFTVLEVATKMIVISDNTATNMIIERLGGQEKLNSRFQSWGLTTTAIKNPLPDLEGTNTTSPKDLVEVMAMVNRGELVSMRSRDRMLGIMRQTVTNTLLPQGLGKGSTIAHKTGDIGSVVGDVGLIDMPSGKRYLAAVLVKRPHNNPKAQELIRQISRATYNHFIQANLKSEVSSSDSVVIPTVPSQPQTNSEID
ncbi:serine hydrolase, partial [Merismopedia glauca]|uniref:serine hydrolase n=1 Tax=Merismopedia glauca TaxID=292586 RepID=UPI0030DCE37A